MIIKIFLFLVLVFKANCYCQVSNDPCSGMTCNTELIYPTETFENGITDGNQTSLPMIDNNFIQALEGLCLCAYVRFDDKCNVHKSAGLTIGMGIDLNSIDRVTFGNGDFANLPSQKGSVLKTYCKANPSSCNKTLDEDTAKKYSEEHMEKQLKALESEFNIYPKAVRKSKKFADLNRATRTVLFSLYYQYGSIEYFDDILDDVLDENWKDVFHELYSKWS